MQHPRGKPGFQRGQDRNIQQKIVDRGDSAVDVLESLRAAEVFEELRKGWEGRRGCLETHGA